MLGNQEIHREGSTVLPFLTGDHAAIYRQDLWAEVAGQQHCSCWKWIPAVCTEHNISNIPGHQQCPARQPGPRASTSLSQSQHPSPLLWALLSVLVTSLVTVDKCSTRKQWRLERPLLVQCLWDYSLLWQGRAWGGWSHHGCSREAQRWCRYSTGSLFSSFLFSLGSQILAESSPLRVGLPSLISPL